MLVLRLDFAVLAHNLAVDFLLARHRFFACKCVFAAQGRAAGARAGRLSVFLGLHGCALAWCVPATVSNLGVVYLSDFSIRRLILVGLQPALAIFILTLLIRLIISEVGKFMM